MDERAGYRPVDPAAYGGRPRLRALLRPHRAPFVVDAPGVYVGETAAGRGDARLVHWEAVAGVVVLTTPGSRSPLAIGLRTRRHPDVVSVRRELGSWTLRRSRLTAAVARFAPGVPVTDRPSWDTRGRPPRRFWTTDPYEREFLALLAADIRRDALADLEAEQVLAADPRHRHAAALGRAYPHRPTTHDPVDYEPADPAAYVARHEAQAEVVALAVDAPGVYFGPAADGEPDHEVGLVAWADVTSVVVFDVQHDELWRRAVGITARGRPATDIARAHTAGDWRLDRSALEAAVARFAPDVPVVDGPPMPRPSPWRFVLTVLGEQRQIRRSRAVARSEGWGT